MGSERIKILLTDADYSVLQKYRNSLVKNGYEVYLANAEENFSFLLKSHRFDVILIDLSIKGIDAFDVIDSFVGSSVDTAIISSSDTENYDVAIETIRRGAVDLLVKPFDEKILLNTIEQTVSNLLQNKQEKSLVEEMSHNTNIYQYLIENSRDIHFVLDEDGKILFINKRVEALLGYSPEELINQPCSQLVCEDDRERAQFRLHDKRRSSIGSKNVELRFSSKYNRRYPRYFEVKSTPIPRNSPIDTDTIEMDHYPLRSAASFVVARDISDRKKIENIVNRKASYDHLTGLPNKILFFDRLNMAISHAKRNNSMFSVMFLDLDEFKEINDVYGHYLGDKVLQAMSLRMQDCLRESDTLARIGGDEFTLLLPEINSSQQAAIIAKKLIAAINKPFTINDTSHQLSVSIGISLYPQDALTREALIQSADHAMYQVKNSQKNGFQFYSDPLKEI